jgi:N-acetylmuramoyl-L-alanine amidase
MKKLLLATFLLSALLILPVSATTHLTDKVIALDAGHDDISYGASNVINGVLVKEADVNWDVVQVLKEKLEAQGANVVVTERFSTRRDRVADAVDKCQTLYDRKCDVLVSVHHNGNTDPEHDGTLVIYNEKKDIALAEKMHDALVPMTGNDEGYLHGGYGMTVYKNLVSVITEAYYITNDDKAARYVDPTDTTDGVSNLVIEEANAQLQGISDYFAGQSDGGDGGNGGGDNCSPGKAKQNKC